MDNNTLLTLVCILIAVIALLVCTSLFFIYTLEEKNAHQRHVIDVLLSTIKRLKVQNDNNMKQHTITCLTLLLTLCACSDPQEQPRDGIDLTGAWVLRHVKFPSGTEQDYALDGDGTTCLIYDQRNLLYECNIATTPTGLLVQPTATTTITLVDKGGGEWLYLENGDPHPLRATDSTITIQRMGILYTFSRADSLYSEWGADIRDIFDRATDSPETENTRYMLSARERQLTNYVYWLVVAVALVVIAAVANSWSIVAAAVRCNSSCSRFATCSRTERRPCAKPPSRSRTPSSPPTSMPPSCAAWPPAN